MNGIKIFNEVNNMVTECQKDQKDGEKVESN